MSNVIIDREKIDILANAISDKSGVPITMTLEEMVEAVDGIESNPAPTLQAKTYTVDSAGTETVTADSGYDGLSSVAVSVPIADLIIDESHEFYIVNGIKKWRVKGYADDDDGALKGWFEGSQSGGYTSFNAVPSGTSVTPTESSQTIGGANYMMEGAVTVNAIPSNYVGSGITRRSSTDLTASGATVTVPSGYYSAQASKAVANGTAGTPTATKGSVSNHSVSVTPSVTNTSGYISGGTINGTAVTVTASELASGTYNVTSAGTKDVTNYASASVPSGTEGTPTATKGTVSNHSVSVTPSVTNTGGYITGSTKTGTAVTVSASELVSGTYTVDSSGTKDVTNYASASVPAGTAGTPSASKGAVSNHSVSVTPSVTNTTGWITGSTKTGTAVTVTASELASGNKAITQNGTNIDVVGYSTVSVDVRQQFTATIENNGAASGYNYAYVQFNNTNYYTAGDTFTFSEGDTLTCLADARSGASKVYVNDEEVSSGYTISYAYSLPASDITIKFSAVSSGSSVKIYTAGATLITKTITTNGTYDAEDDNADGYSQVIVNVSGGGSVTVTDVANATGTTCVITSGGSTPTEDIPLNTELIDFTKVTNGYIVDGDTGEETVSQWSSCSDFTLIDPTMTFSYIGYQWYSIVFYDSSKSYISGLNMYQDTGTTITNDYAHGTLTPSKIPSTAKYVRIDSYPTNPSSTQLSLIRTA